PGWCDRAWRSTPATVRRAGFAVGDLQINDEDVLGDPEIALPMRGLQQLVDEGLVGGTVPNHVAVMGYQDRRLTDWHRTTAGEIATYLREQGADGLILAPA